MIQDTPDRLVRLTMTRLSIRMPYQYKKQTIMHQSSRIELNDCVRHLMSICGDDQSAHSPGFAKMWQPRDDDWSVFSEIIIPKGALASVEQAWPGTIAMMAKAAMASSCGPVLPLVALCDDLAGMSLDALTIQWA